MESLRKPPHGSCGRQPKEGRVSPCKSPLEAISAAYFLLSLQTVNDGRELAQDLVCLLVVLHLSSDELGKVAKGLGCIENLMKSQWSCA